MAVEGWSFRLGLRFDLGRFGVMVQAAVSYSLPFDPFVFKQDGLAEPEVDVGRSDIVDVSLCRR